MTTFVLVHGAWHAAWCWDVVKPLLETERHRVLTPDLPGHGEDPTPVAEMTLESAARRVQEDVRRADEPVILVGHSMGGMVITQVAEYVPERIRLLVYVAAFLPADGQSQLDLARSIGGGTAPPRFFVRDDATGATSVRSDAPVNLFYGECTAEDAAGAMARLRPESRAVFRTPVHVTPERAGAIRRAYIETLRDGALSITLQRSMQRALPCAPVLRIDTDHSPFLSRPKKLATLLSSLADVEGGCRGPERTLEQYLLGPRQSRSR